MSAMVGSENTCHIELQQFAKRFGSHEIDQKLLNIVSELPNTKVADAGVFKGIVTGDEFMADIKGENRKRILPYAKHIFTANSLPQVADTTDGFYRRLHIIPFENKFEVSSKFDINIFLEQDNLNYLANLCLRAYLKMINSSDKLRFANYEESRKILDNYKKVNDTVLGFLSENQYTSTIFAKDVKTTDMWYWYKEYCRESNMQPIKKMDFYSQLQNKYGFVKKVINGYEYFYRTAPIKSE